MIGVVKIKPWFYTNSSTHFSTMTYDNRRSTFMTNFKLTRYIHMAHCEIGLIGYPVNKFKLYIAYRWRKRPDSRNVARIIEGRGQRARTGLIILTTHRHTQTHMDISNGLRFATLKMDFVKLSS